jgi:hypothetical protein
MKYRITRSDKGGRVATLLNIAELKAVATEI